jgi:hypothetical protein
LHHELHREALLLKAVLHAVGVAPHGGIESPREVLQKEFTGEGLFDLGIVRQQPSVGFLLPPLL